MGKITTEIDRDNDLTINVVTGKITISDIETAVRKYLPNPTKKVLWDYSNGDASAVTNEEFRQFQVNLSRRLSAKKKRKIAIVVARDLGYGLGRMVQTYSEIAQISSDYFIARSLDEAMNWLEQQDGEEAD